MGLWLVMTILCSAAAVGVSIPLVRRFDGANGGGVDAEIYQDQLKEVDKDLAAGSINTPEADSAKIEIQRRIANLEKNIIRPRPISNTWRNVALLASSGLVILGSVALYDLLGSPDLPSAISKPTAASAPQSESQTAQVDGMVSKLTARLQANPQDAEGWRMMGWAQFNLQHYSESADAYAKALALQPTNADYKSAYAEALVQVSQGIVTPQALALFTAVLSKNTKDSRARFYDALSLEQSGDQSGALDRWLALWADTPADAGWRDNVKQRIQDLAKTTGRDVSAALAVAALPAPAPIISDEQKSAIQALPESDQKNMIKSMVERLASKLDANPKDADGWMRLMQSYQVLGETAKAKSALTKALSNFAGDTATLDKLKAAASGYGIN